jgi:hypothetical protein
MDKGMAANSNVIDKFKAEAAKAALKYWLQPTGGKLPGISAASP